MFTLSFGGNLAGGRIGNFINKNSQKMQESYIKVASGKAINTPSDGAGEYIRSDSLEINANKYSNILKDISQGESVINYSEKSNTFIWDDLFQLKGLVKDYYKSNVSTNEKETIEKEFNAIKNRIIDTQKNAIYDGKNVLQDSSTDPLYSFSIDPHDLDNKFIISFDSNTIVDATSFDITIGESAINDLLDKEVEHSSNYGAKLTGYRYGINAQRKLATLTQKGENDSVKSIKGIDEAGEIAKLTKRSIQQGAATSLFAQSQMYQKSVLKLIN